MSAFDSVLKLAKQWQPQVLLTELKYRDSLIAHLREQLREAKIGTTTDIFVKQPGFFGSSEVFVELKRNFLQKAQYDRLVGQIEFLEPKKNNIIVVLCGETNPALLTRLRQRYGGPSEKAVVFIPFAVVEKPVGKT